MTNREPESISASALTHGAGVFDRVIAQVAHQGARFVITRYRKPVALLVPVPDRTASDPNEVLAERMAALGDTENPGKNHRKTPREPSVPPPGPL